MTAKLSKSLPDGQAYACPDCGAAMRPNAGQWEAVHCDKCFRTIDLVFGRDVGLQIVSVDFKIVPRDPFAEAVTVITGGIISPSHKHAHAWKRLAKKLRQDVIATQELLLRSYRKYEMLEEEMTLITNDNAILEDRLSAARANLREVQANKREVRSAEYVELEEKLDVMTGNYKLLCDELGIDRVNDILRLPEQSTTKKRGRPRKQ